MERLATVKATGRRYFISQICFRTDVVHCHGEVVAMRGKRTTHKGALSFPLSEVTFCDVVKTVALCEELFDQAEMAIVEGRLPGYLTSEEARAEARRKRARKKTIVNRMDAAMNRRPIGESVAGIFDVIDSVLKDAAKTRYCGFCSSTKVVDELENLPAEPMPVCRSCKVEYSGAA